MYIFLILGGFIMTLKESFDKWLERIMEEAEEACSVYKNAHKEEELESVNEIRGQLYLFLNICRECEEYKETIQKLKAVYDDLTEIVGW